MKHNCGLAVAHSLHDVYAYISSLQHRGREAAGIAAIGEKRIDVVKWVGLVKDFSLTDLHKIFPAHRYHTYIAHVRYATRGRKDKILEDAHPHTIGGTVYNRGSHVFILDCEMAIVHNGQVGDEYLGDINRSCLRTDCDTEALLHFHKAYGEYELMQKIPGAYTLAIADKNKPEEVIVMRDQRGIKPGVLGEKDGKSAIASEDIALEKNGARFIEDLTPGSIYYLDNNGSCRKVLVVEPQPAYCFFEWNYIAHVKAILNGVNVLRLRQLLGKIVAQETQLKLDWVSYVPRCPEVAARAYATELKLPFDDKILYKMKTERAFQGSTADEREKSIFTNLYLQPEATIRLCGQTGAIIDDSTVRGNNARRARYLLYDEARVKECHVVNYTPQIGIVGADGIPRGCMFGVDMPPDDNFIARGRNVEEINAAIGMPVHYISVEGMLSGFESLGMPREHLCTYCIGGKHPFKTT